MDIASSEKPGIGTTIGNVAVFLALAILCAYFWLKTGKWMYAAGTGSFLLRAPVSFHHPVPWDRFVSSFNKSINYRLAPRRPFSVADSIFSIISFALLILAIGLYVLSLVRSFSI